MNLFWVFLDIERRDTWQRTMKTEIEGRGKEIIKNLNLSILLIYIYIYIYIYICIDLPGSNFFQNGFLTTNSASNNNAFLLTRLLLSRMREAASSAILGSHSRGMARCLHKCNHTLTQAERT